MERSIKEKPLKNGRYLVKFHRPHMPEYDSTEMGIREFKDGEWIDLIYNHVHDGYEAVSWYDE